MYVEPESNLQTTDISGTDVTLEVQLASENTPELNTDNLIRRTQGNVTEYGEGYH